MITAIASFFNSLLKTLKFKPFWYLLVIVVIGLGLRLYNLDSFSLWTDEGYTSNTINKTYLDIIRVAQSDLHPPLYHLLIKFITTIFGNSVMVMRMVSVFFGTITIIISYYIGRKIFNGSTTLALVLSSLVASNPLLLIYSQEARNYAIVVFLTSILILSIVSLKSKMSNYWLLLMIITGIVGLYIHALFIVILGSLALYCFIVYFIIDKQIILSIKLTIVYIIIAFCYTPWLFILSGQTKTAKDIFWLKFDPVNDLIRNTTNFFTSETFYDFGLYTTISKNILEVVGSILFVAGFSIATKKIDSKYYQPLFLVFCLLFSAFIFSFISPIYYIRYLIYITIPILIICTIGLETIFKYYYKSVAVGLFLVFLITSTLFFTNNIQQNPNRYDYRSVVKYTKSIAIGNYIVLHPSSMSSWDAFKYHDIELKTSLNSKVYSPNRNDVKYMKAVINEEEYFNKPLKEYKTIIVVFAYGQQHLIDDLTKIGYCEVSNKQITQLHVLEWQEC
jgi:uncharacterized membrane protein